jgi:hypothetical protein
MVNSSTPNTGSQWLAGGANSTRTALSTNIIIQVSGTPVGAVSKLTINENRGIQMIDEVGTDGHIDSAPNKSTDIEGSCSRTRFDGLRIAAAFSRGFVHVHAQRTPFDIVILDIFAADANNTGLASLNKANLITTVIKNVWISKIGYSYNAGDFIITEDLDWKAETIYSYVGQNQPAFQGTDASRQVGAIYNVFEKEADIGNRRGALDGPGLIREIDNVANNG